MVFLKGFALYLTEAYKVGDFILVEGNIQSSYRKECGIRISIIGDRILPLNNTPHKYVNHFEVYGTVKSIVNFGDMHKIINKKFPKAQYFGFTGTPRFPENPSQDGRTTADIFEKCLHTYLIKDAIKDNNVLGWSVDYIKTINSNYDEEDQTKVEAIDTDEVIMSDERIELVAKNILQIHKAKTRNKTYNALFTVKSIQPKFQLPPTNLQKI